MTNMCNPISTRMVQKSDPAAASLSSTGALGCCCIYCFIEARWLCFASFSSDFFVQGAFDQKEAL